MVSAAWHRRSLPAHPRGSTRQLAYRRIRAPAPKRFPRPSRMAPRPSQCQRPGPPRQKRRSWKGLFRSCANRPSLCRRRLAPIAARRPNPHWIRSTCGCRQSWPTCLRCRSSSSSAARSPTLGSRRRGVCSSPLRRRPSLPSLPSLPSRSRPKRPRMSNEQFFLVVGLLLFLIGTPLLIALVVRVLVRDTPDAVLVEQQEEVVANFESLGDFWAGIAPHLVELRNRLTKGLLAVLAGTIIGFWIVNSTWLLGDTLPNVLIGHFVPPEIKLQFIEPAEAFVNYMRIALVIGVALAIPVIIY